jgi:two-component system, cell cycle response regulator CpdR
MITFSFGSFPAGFAYKVSSTCCRFEDCLNLGRRLMGEKFKATALVVEDDQIQRAMVAMLLEETDIQVIQCESAEAAELVLEKVGGCLCMMFTDVFLAGRMTGAELATKARRRFPDLKVIVTSGRNPPDLPEGTMFMPKPWRALDVVREAALSRH